VEEEGLFIERISGGVENCEIGRECAGDGEGNGKAEFEDD